MCQENNYKLFFAIYKNILYCLVTELYSDMTRCLFFLAYISKLSKVMIFVFTHMDKYLNSNTGSVTF